MAKKKADGTKKPDPAASPWLKGVTGVSGVSPPGRRLSPPSEKRPTRWSASGVHGVVPPGTQKVGDNPGVEWAEKAAEDKAKSEKSNTRALQEKKGKAGAGAAKAAKKRAEPEDEGYDPARPTAGFVPQVFADQSDPDDLKAFLEAINELLSAHRPHPECAEHFAQLISQSHAPYEIIVAFTILNALVGKSTPLRRRYGLPLERGAKVFYNLAMRLNSGVKSPRGLVPETVDALFYDLPSTALQLPYAFATDAFLRQLELLRLNADESYDYILCEFALKMRRRFIEPRSFGDQPLARMFPWELPEWAPADLA